MAAGYVLGSRAGRQRYEQIRRTSGKVWNSGPVQKQVVNAKEVARTKAAPVVADMVADAARATGEKLIGVIPKPRNQLDLVRNSDQVIVGPHCKGVAFDMRVLIVGKDNNGRVLRWRDRAKLADQHQSVNVRHCEIQQDYGRLQLVCRRKGIFGLLTGVKIDIALARQCQANGFTLNRIW